MKLFILFMLFAGIICQANCDATDYIDKEGRRIRFYFSKDGSSRFRSFDKDDFDNQLLGRQSLIGKGRFGDQLGRRQRFIRKERSDNGIFGQRRTSVKPDRKPADFNLPISAAMRGHTLTANWWITAGLLATLSAKGPFTALVSPNSLWNNLGLPDKKFFLHDITARKQCIQSMIMKGKFFSKDFTNDQLVPSLLENFPIRVNVYKKTIGDVITFSGAPVNTSAVDLPARNGLIHLMSRIPLRLLENIADHISSESSKLFSVFNTILQRTGLDELLKRDGPFTVFAPTNEAFNALDDKNKRQMEKDVDFMYEVAAYHVIRGQTLFQAGFNDEEAFRTVLREYLTVRISNGQGSVEDNFGRKADIIVGDFAATNGAIHTIDRVMLPRGAFFRKRRY